MKEIGKDTDGITETSFKAIEKLAEEKKLHTVTIETNGKTSFIFEDETFYTATGFAIGYGGEGPHGLHKAIRLWFPKEMDSDFWKTKISKLDRKSKWLWTSKTGFIRL